MSNQQKIIKRNKHGVYNLMGITGQDKVIIKGAGNIKLNNTNDSVADSMIERFNISPDVYGEMYKCNILDKYLMSTKKLPLFYVSVIYEKPLIRSPLFTTFLYFTINDTILNENELIDSEINGKFTVELILDENNIILDSDKSFQSGFPGKDEIYKILKKMVLEEDLQPIIKNLINKKNEDRRNKMKEQYAMPDTYSIPKVSYRFDDLL